VLAHVYTSSHLPLPHLHSGLEVVGWMTSFLPSVCGSQGSAAA